MPQARKFQSLDLLVEGIEGRMKPAEKSLRWLHLRGFRATRVDRQLGPFHQEDAYGFADLHFFGPSTQGFVQATSIDHFNDHYEKVRGAKVAKEWARAGNVVELHCWGKGGRLRFCRMFNGHYSEVVISDKRRGH